MSVRKCRAKNPAACRSPRCPGRRGFFSSSGSRAGGEESLANHVSNARLVSPSVSHAQIIKDERLASLRTVKKMSPAQRQALQEYTNQSYSALNEALRNGDQLNDSQKELVRQLDSVLVTEPSQPRILYRALLPPDEEETQEWVGSHFDPGTVVTFPAYSSTTASKTSLVAMLRERPSTPTRFLWGTREDWVRDIEESVSRNVVLEMVTGSGVSVSALSHMPQEAEALLPRGQSYYVQSVDKVIYENRENISTGEISQDARKYPVTRIRLIDVSLLKND